MSINSLKEFLKDDRELSDKNQKDLEKQNKDKDRTIKKIMDSNIKLLGQAFRQASTFTRNETDKERQLTNKQRGIIRRMLDANTRFMGMALNKLFDWYMLRKKYIETNMKFVLRGLTDKDFKYVLMAYNILKQRKRKLDGVGKGTQETLKNNLIKRLLDKNFNLVMQAWNTLLDNNKWDKFNEANDQNNFLNKEKTRNRALRRIITTAFNDQTLAFKLLKINCYIETHHSKDNQLKQKAIILRIVNSNMRLLGLAFNKLVAESKMENKKLDNTVKFVIEILYHKDKMFTLMAYNGMKQLWMMKNGVGKGNIQIKKIDFIKRLTNNGLFLQKMAIHSLKDFLEDERIIENEERLEYEREIKEKDRVLKRIMNNNLLILSMAFRKAKLFAHENKDTEELLALKHRGIMKRLVDVNTRLLSMAFNKLLEEHNIVRAQLRNK